MSSATESERWIPGALLGEIPGFSALFVAHTNAGYRVTEKRCLVHQLTGAGDRDFIVNGLHEVEWLASLLPKGVVQEVLEVGIDPETFCRLEYVVATPMSHYLQSHRFGSKRLGLPAVASIAVQLCDALIELHEATAEDGEVLQVLASPCPETVWLDVEGKLRMNNPATERRLGWAMHDLATRIREPWEHESLGYLSPEQLRGDVVTERSDIFHVGMLVIGLLLGRSVHGGQATLPLMVEAVRKRMIEPKLIEELPPALHSVLTKATSLAPSKRHANMRSLADELVRAFEEAGAGRAAPPIPHRATGTQLLGLPRLLWSPPPTK